MPAMGTRLPWALFLLALLLAPARAQDDQGEALPPEATEAYEKALAKQRKGIWKAAQRAFRKFVETWPDDPRAQDARDRSGDNAYLGVEKIHDAGPSARRIDVAVMGDGFTLDGGDQALEEKWANLCRDVLWNEKAYEEYQNYFNLWFVRLASFEEGVDPGLSPEELKKKQERNLRRHRDINYKLDYKTALDCKAAGPQGQVMSDYALVFKWLDVAARDEPGCADDRLVIAFAQFGVLGMGGGGIANVGRPDKSVTVHEFGHAFVRLLDEYAINPQDPSELGAYGSTLKAANAWPSPTEPKPSEVPWAHLLAKHVKGVGIYEGGATFKKGVWRPAASCAMNVGGNQYCPVCREQAVLVIYEYVSPIDEALPDPAREVHATCGGPEELVVVPMQPRRHKLDVEWYIAPLEVTTTGSEPAPAPTPAEEAPQPAAPEKDYPDFPDERQEMGFLGGGYGFGRRALVPRDEYDAPPEGEPSKLGKRKRDKERGNVSVFPLGKLPAGGYVITAEVHDPTPWVVKDSKHLLRERVSWRVKVAPKE